MNITDNGKILKKNYDIQISDFMLLTGENGSGKTQLLEFIRDYAGGFAKCDEFGNECHNDIGEPLIVSPLFSEENEHLTEIIYSYPGLRNSIYPHDYQQQSLMGSIIEQWTQLQPFVWAYNAIKHKVLANDEIGNARTKFCLG
ncbi:hypothetical protein ACQ86K_26675 [Mucilaginibacter sp. P19]|uniref:hypothetical protein n=1 Tax=Mucilaginibacter sp. P19 TaxID=3423947 RepID=UPI003D669A00